jgi:hypothetical protein
MTFSAGAKEGFAAESISTGPTLILPLPATGRYYGRLSSNIEVPPVMRRVEWHLGLRK